MKGLQRIQTSFSVLLIEFLKRSAWKMKDTTFCVDGKSKQKILSNEAFKKFSCVYFVMNIKQKERDGKLILYNDASSSTSLRDESKCRRTLIKSCKKQNTELCNIL